MIVAFNWLRTMFGRDRRLINVSEVTTATNRIERIHVRISINNHFALAESGRSSRTATSISKRKLRRGFSTGSHIRRNVMCADRINASPGQHFIRESFAPQGFPITCQRESSASRSEVESSDGVLSILAVPRTRPSSVTKRA
ncbi:hypothetical protein PUN28_004957 [Cardiocondyla obscurior]|uniref:FHA domain-containing protein n=1 Tax=Cardiocondyla obscurior TaxID=286306 RepID=A0AAW2GG12_9HYME